MMNEHGQIADDIVGFAAEIRRAPAGLGVTQVMVAHVYGVSLESLLAATRCDRRVAEARQVAMYLAHVVLRMSLAAVARGFGRDRTTASHACRHIENMREDPELDRLVAWLEVLLREAAGGGR